VARAFSAVPRHLFVPDVALADAYRDDVVFTKRDADGTALSSVSAPWLVAAMLERLGPPSGGRVLEIGSGGWNAALLRHLVGPGGSVTSVDIDAEVIARAARCLAGTPWQDVRLVLGDGWSGVPDGAPYDGITVTVQATALADAWLDQLAPGGRLVVPLRVRGLGRLLAFARDGDQWRGGGWEQCGFVRMRGRGAREPVATTALGEGVRLRVDGELQPDRDALLGALAHDRREVWTGVTTGPAEGTRAVLDLWFATVLDAYGRLHTDPPGPRPGTSLWTLPGGTPATWNGDTLAYLVLRPAAHGTDRFEYGIAHHGPDRALADRCAEWLRTWDRDHRDGPGPTLLAHRAPAAAPPPRGPSRVLSCPGPRLTLTWS
jgi:protein-L-isoaspartate(D-aspartate) O-methyltransferase